MTFTRKNLFLGVFLALSGVTGVTGAMAQSDAAPQCSTLQMEKEWLVSQDIDPTAVADTKPLSPADFNKLVDHYANEGATMPDGTVFVYVTVVPAGEYLVAYDANGCQTGNVVISAERYAAIFS